MPRPDEERLHFHVAPQPGTTTQSALDHFLALGATRLDVGHECADAISLADVDGNSFCLFELESSR